MDSVYYWAPWSKGRRRHCFHVYGVAQHTEDTPGQSRQGIPANDEVVLQNKQVVYVPDDNYRNPMREAKDQQKLLRDYFNHVGASARQEHRILDWSYHGDTISWHL